MRDYIFRAWDKNRKKMIFDPIELEILVLGLNNTKNPLIGSETQPNNIGFNSWFYGQRFEMTQSTGETDKNGKDIYEGDILETCDECPLILVIWGEFPTPLGWYGKYLLKEENEIDEKNYCHINSTIKYTSKIIGNMFENPKLLERKI